VIANFAPFATALALLAAVGAQYVWPRWPGFHEWQYATVLGAGAVLLIGAIWSVRSNSDRRSLGLVAAASGALIAVVAGLAAGLLGPDTQTIARGPGSVVPLPDLGVAVAFPNAGAADVAAGNVGLELRRRGSVTPLAAGSRRIEGSTLLETERRPAVFVAVEDARGRHMTVTQPAGTAFLSPVLLFGQTVSIGGGTMPADGFAVPALQKSIKAVLFPAGALKNQRLHGLPAGKDAVLFVVDDPGGRMVRGGIGLSLSGKSITLGDVSVTPAIGSYPALIVSSIPYPAAFILGLIAFFGGALFAAAPAPQARAEGVIRTA
jgi:hypothetical protein